MNDLIYVGFNSQVAAIHRETGDGLWKWKSPKGGGYVTLLLDGDRLIVSVQGYTYCLDPLTGQELWFNPLDGMGIGVASLASVRGGNSGILDQSAQEEIARHSAASTPT